jgi:hypothetical protein
MTKSSTGGLITFINGGLRHTPAAGAYSGRLAEEGIEATVFDAPKRGRGRPKKISATGAAYDFSAFGRVKIPLWTGTRNIYTKTAE